MSPARKLVVLVAAAAVAATASASVTAAPERLHAVGLGGPTKIVQGDKVVMTATAPGGARCTLSLQYRNGGQRVGPVAASGGRAVFRFTVARRAAPGRATAKATCAGAGTATKSLIVIGSVVAPKINVLKQGFSIRPNSRGTSSTVSWGVILQNTAPRHDAVNVSVLANFVLPDNTLIGSMVRRISRVRANAMGVVGGDLRFLGVPPIARLEVVVRVTEGDAPQTVLPVISNEHVVANMLDPYVVGAVQGEVSNDDIGRTMRYAELYVVALDGAGNVLGGGSGSARAAIPAGAREFFKISGLSAVPMHAVASLVVVAVPYYED